MEVEARQIFQTGGNTCNHHTLHSVQQQQCRSMASNHEGAEAGVAGEVVEVPGAAAAAPSGTAAPSFRLRCSTRLKRRMVSSPAGLDHRLGKLMAGAGRRPTTVSARKEARQAKRKGPPPREEEAPRKKAKPAPTEVKAAPAAKSSSEKGKDEEPKARGKEREKAEPKKKELVLPEDDGDVEDREIAWLEYMLKNGGEEDGLDDGLDGESLSSLRSSRLSFPRSRRSVKLRMSAVSP